MVSPGMGGTIASNFVIVPPRPTSGVQKVKLFAISMSCDEQLAAGGVGAVKMYWCLVFVPEGTVVGAINFPNTPKVPKLVLRSQIH
jgi:hypothetical protein